MAFYAAPAHFHEHIAVEAVMPGAGRRVTSRSAPPPIDWIFHVPEAIRRCQTMSHLDLLKAAVAGRLGYPVVVLAEFLGAWTTATGAPGAPEAGEPPRGICRPLDLSDDPSLGWGSGGFQMLAPGNFFRRIAPVPIREQLQDFETSACALCRLWACQVLESVLDDMRDSFEPMAATLLSYVDQAITPYTLYVMLGGFTGAGRAVSWGPRDNIPFACHLLKHRLRQVSRVSLWSTGDLQIGTLAPLEHVGQIWDPVHLNAIQGLRTWDLANLPAWEDAITTNHWLPGDCIADVLRYFTADLAA